MQRIQVASAGEQQHAGAGPRPAVKPPPGLEGLPPSSGSSPPGLAEVQSPLPRPSPASRALVAGMLVKLMSSLQERQSGRAGPCGGAAGNVILASSASRLGEAPPVHGAYGPPHAGLGLGPQNPLAPTKEAWAGRGSSGDLSSTCGPLTHDRLEPLSDTEDEAVEESEEKRTTLMVRNIPIQYNQETLLQEWSCVDGGFDLLYLPRHSGGQSNLGFAFINFVSASDAALFKASWQGGRLARFETTTCLNVTYADVQGFAANVAQLKKRRVGRTKSPQWQPTIWKHGRRITLDEA